MGALKTAPIDRRRKGLDLSEEAARLCGAAELAEDALERAQAHLQPVAPTQHDCAPVSAEDPADAPTEKQRVTLLRLRPT